MLKSAPARCARRRVEGKIAAIQAPSPHKDNESLLQMLVELCREPDEPKWTLDVAGPGDWSPWQSRARQLGIQDRVRFIGACDAKQVQDLLLRSECLVFASCFEAFGLPVIEAMSCGCPVIAVNATAIPEVAGSAALLVPPHSPQQLAEGVRMLRVDDTVRRRLIEQGYERSKLFLWNDSARVFMKLFESAVSGARPLTEV
jgi:glycosyltransferase involved in cell wall biosynthesis